MELLSKNLIRNGQKYWQIARCGSKSRVLEGDCGFGWESEQVYGLMHRIKLKGNEV